MPVGNRGAFRPERAKGVEQRVAGVGDGRIPLRNPRRLNAGGTWLESGMSRLPPLRPNRATRLNGRTSLLTAGVVLLAVVAAAPLVATAANVLPSVYEPAGTGGYAALDRALAKLQTHRRLLVVGAHPDDEDTSALALVSRELGGEAAYLSLSRGEGGQNLIGPDLGEALGVLRTEELLAARGVDGARQYFTRAFDFGYTRSLPETLGKWPEEALLADAVRVVRRFKPQVILSVFGNDGSGGHGQHQAAGHTAFLAFARSAEPLPALEQSGRDGGALEGRRRSIRAAWFAPESATVSRPLGAIDPWSGMSTVQLAMKSRGPAPLAGHGAAPRARAARRQVHLRRGTGRRGR